jgi:hypothetical protein
VTHPPVRAGGDDGLPGVDLDSSAKRAAEAAIAVTRIASPSPTARYAPANCGAVACDAASPTAVPSVRAIITRAPRSRAAPPCPIRVRVDAGRVRARPSRRASDAAPPAQADTNRWPRRGLRMRSRQPDVPALMRRLLFPLAQVGLLDRGHNRPVPTHRAALEPPEPEPHRLDGRSRNPDRRVNVAAPAPDHDIAAQPPGAQPYAADLNEEGGNPNQDCPTTPRSSANRSATPAPKRESVHCSSGSTPLMNVS